MKNKSSDDSAVIKKLHQRVDELEGELRLMKEMQKNTYQRDRDNQDLIKKLLEALNIAKVGYVYWEIPGGELVWSKQMFSIHRRPQQHAPTFDEYYSMYVHPEDVDKLISTLDAAFLNHSNYEITYRLLLDNEVRYVKSSSVFLRSINKEKLILIGTLTDYTEQKKREENLEKEAGLFKEMFYDNNTIHCLLDCQSFRIVKVNSAAAKYYQMSSGQLVGKLYPEFLIDIIEPAGTSFSDIIHKNITRFIVKQRDTNNQIRFVENYISRLSLNNQNLLYLLQFDITEKMIAGQALRQSEQRYRRLFDSMNDAVFVHRVYDDGSVGNFYEVNKAACDRLGYTREEFMTMSPVNIDDAKAPKLPKEELLNFMKTKKSLTFEVVHVAKDGKKIPVEISATFFEYQGTNAVLSIVHDITERKIAENKLKNSEQSLKIVLQNLPGGVFVHDVNGDFIFVNEDAANNTGYSMDQLLQMNVSDIDRQSEINLDTKNLWKSLQKGEAKTIESCHIRKDESRYPAEIHLNAISLHNKKVILAIAFDITERVRIREAVRESKERYRTLFNYSPLPLLEVNLETTLQKLQSLEIKNESDLIKSEQEQAGLLFDIAETQFFLDCNKTGYEFFGVSSITELNKMTKELISKEGMKIILKNLIYLQNGLKTTESDTIILNVKGRKVHVIFKLYILPGAEKNWKKVLISLTNINRLKEAEAKLKKFSEELQEINKSKDKFFSIIAHDLRVPLTGLIGFSDQLVRKSDSLPPEKIKHYSSRIYDASKIFQGLLTNLLEWSRLQRNKMEYHPVSIDTAEFVDRIITIFRSVAENKDISLINRIDDENKIYADELSMESVLRNLISNAIKFTNRGGKITISAGTSGKYTAIYIEDNGIGMTPETTDMLFRIDRQISTKGTQKESGTGLGLILCKEFVEMNKGTISVDSHPGKGSTFTLTLPAYDR